MPTLDPRIDAYIAKKPDFARPILAHVRAAIHRACPDAVETLKWSMPFFLYRGEILCSMSAFKQHAAFGFWKGELVTGQSGQGAMGSFGRLTTIADLPPDAELEALIAKAMALTEAGVKEKRPVKHPKPPLETPGDLADALAGNDAARATFEGFSPSGRREYVEWLVEAKRPETRAKRLAQAVEWMAEGKQRNWKYMEC